MMNKNVLMPTKFNSENSGHAALLGKLAERFSCRAFDGTPIDQNVLREIVIDGTQAPSSCNQQQWHYIIITNKEDLKRANEIAGGNPHFSECSALIYLTFQMGWAHDNFSVVQSVGAACYHMMLSAHLRGFSTIWNAGIGDQKQLREMMAIPPIFNIIGALAIGRSLPSAPQMKAPRRPAGSILSFDTFSRPASSIYPAKPSGSYSYSSISKADNKWAEWDPKVWSWDQLGDFRGYSVWAKSPTAGVYQSQRQGDAIEEELRLLPQLPHGATVIEIAPWGGTTTTSLRAHLSADKVLDVVELAEPSCKFIKERLRQEGLGDLPTVYSFMECGRLPQKNASADVVVFFQSLEHLRDHDSLLAEVRRVLKPGGALVISMRNMTSRYGQKWRQVESKGQVPLQGPFVPFKARDIYKLIEVSGFRVEADLGIGIHAAGDSSIGSGIMRLRRRILGIRARTS
jgi:nitroreductase/ubiquinone/menaquinone biosynthesis C-methylase UbiE